MRTFRLKRKSYIVGLEYEEGCDMVQRYESAVIIWHGVSEDEPDVKFFKDIGIDLPADENEVRGGEPNNLMVGDAEYSYVLEELIDGKWRYVNHLHDLPD